MKTLLSTVAVLIAVQPAFAQSLKPSEIEASIASMRRELRDNANRDDVDELQRDVDRLGWQLARELDRRALQEQKNQLEHELKAVRAAIAKAEGE